MEDVGQESCFGAGSVAGAVIGTFLTTILLLAVAALLYRQWRRHKGKHLVLVTDPEIVEDAYAFDNPCFKDATPAVSRVVERTLSTSPTDIPTKDPTRWSTPWTSLGLGSGNRNDKRRTLDDSCLGSKATRVSMVSLRSRDFTGLGFNVCGNMREGIFVKDLLHRGPASESGKIHPGDRIASVKISFRNMVYEDALTILSYASPYDVELEVESGGTGSKPTTLLKKTVGPSPNRICHPLYRSQSIPELSQAHKSAAKRLFIADPNESVNSNYSTMNSTIKSSKSTPGSQTLERLHEQETKNNHHHKFGIKVLPALDGTVHRVENQNEHNTNLERRHSKKMEKQVPNNRVASGTSVNEERKICPENLQTRENQQAGSRANKRQQVVAPTSNVNGIDVSDKGQEAEESINIPSEVPAEVHNAAMAARRNRKNSAELLAGQKVPNIETSESDGPKSPQKNKRKAPAPPRSNTGELEAVPVTPEAQTAKQNAPLIKAQDVERVNAIDSIADYTESLNDYVAKVREDTDTADARRQRIESQTVVHRRNSESDTDSEVQNSFTTIELNPGDITIHRTPVPEANDDEDDEDDIYRKAASLGDLSKYENKSSTPLERAQSLDMTDTGSKKRKAPLPPEDINESTEDLTKLDQMDTFDRRKLKKSSEWGTMEDVFWGKPGEMDEKSIKTPTRKKSNGTLERSKSAVEIKLKEEVATHDGDETVDVDNKDSETSIELFNLPLSKRLTQEFIHAERMFNPDEDNSLARIVNDGRVVKSPTLEEVELDFRQAVPVPDEDEEKVEVNGNEDIRADDGRESSANEEFSRALRYFEQHSSRSPNLTESKEEKGSGTKENLYANRKPVVEEPITKVSVERGCRACEKMIGKHGEHCEHRTPERNKDHADKVQSSAHALRVPASKAEHVGLNDSPETKFSEESASTFQARRTKFEQSLDQRERHSPGKSKSPVDSPFETHFAKRVINISDNKSFKSEDDNEVDEDEYEFGTGVTINSRNLSANEDRHNVSNVSVSSGENSEDSGLVRESMEYNSRDAENRPPLPSTPVPNSSQKMTYVTEIKVSANRENQEQDSENEEIVAIIDGNGDTRKAGQHEITVTSNGKPTSGKKPPVPPRRSDIAKLIKEDQTEKQIVYVSEYKSPMGKNSQISGIGVPDGQPAETKKFEHWIFLGDNKEQSRWGNSSSQPQQVTNIMLSSGDEKIVHP